MFYKLIILTKLFIFCIFFNCSASSVKQSEFGGQFYPEQKEELSKMIDNLLSKAHPKEAPGDIFLLLSPHAGYGYSGQTAAYGYKLIKDKPYKTVIIIGTSHHKVFNGAAVYTQGVFVTSLGRINIDNELAKKMIGKDPELFSDVSAFNNEHSVEVQLPFLQKLLPGFSAGAGSASGGKIVPIVVGDCSLETCKKIALLVRQAIGVRKDVLIVVSTDLYHGYDFEKADKTDAVTLDSIKSMDYEKLYYNLRDGSAQACGGFGTVIGLAIAKDLDYKKIEILHYTNSAILTGKPVKNIWTVGYASCVAFRLKENNMLNIQQRKRLINIARQAIEKYLKTSTKLQVNETDPVLNQKMGAFVTLTKYGELRGCIGNLVGTEPLYLTVGNMAIEAAVDDPRFHPLSLSELKDIDLEISVLSLLERVDSAEKIELGKHGVLVKRGINSGVFLPQVATETGWSKEEFLSQLCSQKANLPADAWKDKNTELYIFSAEVFSEKELE
ncbi:MAG: AmmeMemoRadiSam system protein B [Candidatus Omnitrophica bacterium]|nr:AmmeMemoRadiSam system protein B [Candidatus Omnitrophota bacterium]